MEKNYVCMDIPLLVRVLEECRESVHSDAELHFLVNQLIQEQCVKKSPLTMDDYANISQYKLRYNIFEDSIIEDEDD